MSHPREMYDVHSTLRSYQLKVDQARRILDEGAARGEFAVSVSWGKDSVAMLDLAIEHLGRIKAVHLSSPYALPGWERVRDHFADRCDLEEVPAHRTLEEYVAWCREIGLPHERSKSARQKAIREIKGDRGERWRVDRGIDVQAWGLRIDEGGPRARVLKAHGPVYQVASGGWRCCPLAYWSGADVWARIFSRDLPYPTLYDCETHGMTRETIRNTGWLSTDGATGGRIAWLRQHFRQAYTDLVDAFPQVRIHV